jgi:hypothetical protein
MDSERPVIFIRPHKLHVDQAASEYAFPGMRDFIESAAKTAGLEDRSIIGSISHQPPIKRLQDTLGQLATMRPEHRESGIEPAYQTRRMVQAMLDAIDRAIAETEFRLDIVGKRPAKKAK